MHLEGSARRHGLPQEGAGLLAQKTSVVDVIQNPLAVHLQKQSDCHIGYTLGTLPVKYEAEEWERRQHCEPADLDCAEG